MKPIILLPPGIGDIYWVMCILEDFLKVNDFEKPDVYIMSIGDKRDRSIDYVKMLPFVNAAGYYYGDCWKPPVWDEILDKGILLDIDFFTHFICLNGIIDMKGEPLSVTGYKVDYYPETIFKQSDLDFGTDFRKQVGPYIVGFVTDHGMYQKWIAELSMHQTYLLFREIHKQTGCKIVMTGAYWDKNLFNDYLFDLDKGSNILINMIDKTKLGEFFGLQKASNGCIGYCAGNTVMSAVFGKPSVLIWHKLFKEAFWWNACPPDSHHNWYLPVDTSQSMKSIADTFMRLYNNVKGD